MECAEPDRHVTVEYNLKSLFKQRVMGGKSSPSLANGKFKCIALGCYIRTEAAPSY